MSFLWRILPQPFPAPIFVQDYEITKSKGCGTYCAVCCWGYLVAWTLILCVLGLLGAWMWFLMEINYTMPHTFAWESLLRPFGSVPYMTECSSNVTGPGKGDAANALANDCWTSSYTVPCVPIIASMILIMTVINGIWCLLPVPLLNLYSAVLNMRANLAWHLFFFLIAFPVVSVYFALDLTGLRDRMEKTIEIEGDNYTIPPSWAKTQADAHCCGVMSFEDWKSTTGLYPPSCCNTTRDGDDAENAGTVCSSGSPVPASSVWTDGCFNSEYNLVLLYGGLELVLIWCTYCISLALYKLIVSLSLRQYEEARAGGDVSAKAAAAATLSQPQSYQQSQAQAKEGGAGGPIPSAADAKTPLLSQQH